MLRRPFTSGHAALLLLGLALALFGLVRLVSASKEPRDFAESPDLERFVILLTYGMILAGIGALVLGLVASRGILRIALAVVAALVALWLAYLAVLILGTSHW